MAKNSAPVKERTTEKQYRIGEIAEKAGVTARTIRYYEELGLLATPARRESEHRRYAEKDLIYLRRIQQLKRDRKSVV